MSVYYVLICICMSSGACLLWIDGMLGPSAPRIHINTHTPQQNKTNAIKTQKTGEGLPRHARGQAGGLWGRASLCFACFALLLVLACASTTNCSQRPPTPQTPNLKISHHHKPPTPTWTGIPHGAAAGDGADGAVHGVGPPQCLPRHRARRHGAAVRFGVWGVCVACSLCIYRWRDPLID